ncbi:ARID domain-containing protein [Meloidogyne graminicola]|uniref:ARID domain-containing protein n=1 Tax=Meloidogyne graminicola TaxID=189291 RepID=A0A8S9ZWF8_9BILA|nr:ARID domain-containing protein [Meloidogyne graminicola]
MKKKKKKNNSPQDLTTKKDEEEDEEKERECSSSENNILLINNKEQQNWSYEDQFKQLYDLSEDTTRKEWLNDWLQFMHKIGKPVTRIPIMAKQVLDLYELYRLVVQHGGLVEVINKKLWRNEITKGLNLPPSITSAAFTLRTQYSKYLFDYECHRHNFSNIADLQAAVDGNKREGRKNPLPTGTITTTTNNSSSISTLQQQQQSTSSPNNYSSFIIPTTSNNNITAAQMMVAAAAAAASFNNSFPSSSQLSFASLFGGNNNNNDYLFQQNILENNNLENI